MFEVGFSELLLIMALALIVLGPEKLPKVASQVGRWMGRARAMARQFRETLEEEVQLGETQRQSSKPKPTSGSGTATATPAPDPATGAAQDDPDTRHNDYAGAAWEPPDRIDDAAEPLAPITDDPPATTPTSAPTPAGEPSGPQTAADTHEQRGT